MNLVFDPISHVYRVNGTVYPGVTSVLADVGIIACDWWTEEGQKRGTLVHKGIHCYESGLLVDIPSLLQGYLDSYLTWKTAARWEPMDSELKMASKEGFCGTLDQWGFLNGELSLCDFKTGVVRPWTAIQLAAYEHLLREREHLQGPLRRFGVRLYKTGKQATMFPFTDKRDCAVFLDGLKNGENGLLVKAWKEAH